MAETKGHKFIVDLVKHFNGALTGKQLKDEVALIEALGALRRFLTSLVSEIDNGTFTEDELILLKAIVTAVRGFANQIYEDNRGTRLGNVALGVVRAADNVLHAIDRAYAKLTGGGQASGADVDEIQSKIDELIKDGKPLPFDPSQLGR